MGCFNATCGISGLPILDSEHVMGVELQKTPYFNIAENPILRPDDQYCYKRHVTGTYNDYGSIESNNGTIVMSDRDENNRPTMMWMCKLEVFEKFCDFVVTLPEFINNELIYSSCTLKEEADQFIIDIVDNEIVDYFTEDFKSPAFTPILHYLINKQNSHYSETWPDPDVPNNAILDLYRVDYIIRRILGMLGRTYTPTNWIHGQSSDISPFEYMADIIKQQESI